MASNSGAEMNDNDTKAPVIDEKSPTSKSAMEKETGISNVNTTIQDNFDKPENMIHRNECLDMKSFDTVDNNTIYSDGKDFDSHETSEKVIVTEIGESEEIDFDADFDAEKENEIFDAIEQTSISNDVNITVDDHLDEHENVTHKNESLDKKKSFEAVDSKKLNNEESTSDSCQELDEIAHDSNLTSEKVIVTEIGESEEIDFDAEKENEIFDAIEQTSISNDVNTTVDDHLDEHENVTHKNESSDIKKKSFEAVDSKKLNNEESSSDSCQELDEIAQLEIKQYRKEIQALNKDKSSCRPQSSPTNGSKVTPEKCDTSTPQSCSPTSSLDLDEDETTSVVPKRKSSLPCYHQPKPNFADFLIETGKNLSISESKEKLPACQERTFEPKNTGDIVFDVKKDAESNYNKKSRSLAAHYQKMRSINEVSDSTPGKKRTLLKDFLKKEMAQKKFRAFKRKKENDRLQNEIDEELNFEVDSEKDYESSEEENLEEASASFDKVVESHELVDKSDNSSKLEDNSNSYDDSNSCDDLNVSRKQCDPDYQINNVTVIDDSSSEVEADDDDDDDDDIKCIRIKKKKVKVIEESESDSDECCIVFEKDSQCIEKDSCVTNDAENGCIESASMGISSSLPSFQPHGGWACESQVEEEIDAVKAAESNIMQVHKKYSIVVTKEKHSSEDSDSSSDAPPLEESEKNGETNKFGFIFDHPPIPEQENESDVFSSQDIANVCSGVFKNDTPQETRFGEDDYETCIPKFCEPEENAKDFLDMEAELSGDDDGEDDQEEVDGDNVLDIVDDHDMPHVEELREDIAGCYMKQKWDEDRMEINRIQEQVIPDGELSNANARKKKYTWHNKNNPEYAVAHKDESSDDSDDNFVLAEEVNKDKTKFLHEKKEDDDDDDLKEVSSSYKKPNLKIKILGRPEYVQEETTTISGKRSRNSILTMDNESLNKIVKKLKSEEVTDGSRSMKHVIFSSEDGGTKESSEDDKKASSSSVFSKFK